MDHSVDCLTYAPQGWATELPPESGSEKARVKFLASERRVCDSLIRRIQDGQPLLIEPNEKDSASDTQINYLTYVYVLSLAAHDKQSLKILDYGGSLADYYWIGKALCPGFELEYHCKELPIVAEEGRKVSPTVIWHTDDDCLDERYDVVMSSGCLPYLLNWDAFLRQAASAVRGYLFLSQIPTVERAPSYLAVQRAHGMTMFYQVFNKADVLTTVQSTGLHLIREFVMCQHPPVVNAPEQPAFRGWLFRRDAGTT